MSEAPFTRALRVPGASGVMAEVAAGRSLLMTAEVQRVPLLGGRSTDLLSYTCRVGTNHCINPTLRVMAGDTIDVTLDNRLGEDTTIHWHGMLVDEKNDGSGMHPVRHEARFGYRFVVANRPGLYWYHPHPHHRTGLQVHQGMGGLLIVEGPEDEALRKALDLQPGITELALLLQDKQVDERNKLRYSVGEDDWIGNRVMVNWTPEPRFEAAARLYRLRILNGANARVFRLAFESAKRKLPYRLIGTDGGMLAAPRVVSELFLAPAQRVDVLLDLSRIAVGTPVMMRSLPFDPMENEDVPPPADPAVEHPGAPMMGEAMDLMRIDVASEGPAPMRMPSRLSSMPAAAAVASKPRPMRLHMKEGKWFINGYNFNDDMHAVKLRVKRGRREHWDIRNDMVSMPHPMHVHGFQFHVLRRTRSPPQVRRLAVDASGRTAQDLGLMDTVLVWPGETVRIAIDFAQPFSGAQHYMFHCHNLEHEDQGMMMTFAVED